MYSRNTMVSLLRWISIQIPISLCSSCNLRSREKNTPDSSFIRGFQVAVILCPVHLLAIDGNKFRIFELIHLPETFLIGLQRRLTLHGTAYKSRPRKLISYREKSRDLCE